MNDLQFSYRSISPYAGLRIVEDSTLVDVTEDWSEVRSPSRAARRRRQGHPQRIKIVGTPKRDIYRVGDMLIMHPAMRRELDAEIARRVGGVIEDQMLAAILGGRP